MQITKSTYICSMMRTCLALGGLLSFIWLAAQNVGIGTANPQGKLHIYESMTRAWLILDGDGQRADISPRSYGTNVRAGVSCFQARGTRAAPSAVQNGDIIGFIGGRGYGTNQFGPFSDAAVVFRAEGDFSNTSHPAGITLETTPNGSTTRQERVRVTSQGYVGIGTSTPLPMLHIVQNFPNGANPNPRGITVDHYSNDPWAPQINQRKARGDLSSPQAVHAGDVLAAWRGTGYDGTSFPPVRAAIRFRAAQNWSNTAHGTYMTFYTTPNNTIFEVEQMRLTDAGNLGIGIATPEGRLHAYAANTWAWLILEGDGHNADLSPRSYGNNTRPGISCYRARGTKTAPTAVQNNDIIGFIGGLGYGDNQFGSTSDAAVVFRAEGTFTNASHPSAITLETTPLGSTSRSERVRITSQGRVGVGISNPQSILHIVQEMANPVPDPRGIIMDMYGDHRGAAQINQRKARGTPINPTALIQDDILAGWWGRGYDGNGFSGGQAGIAMLTSQAWTPTARGTYIVFSTTLNNTTNAQERVRIAHNGYVGIGLAPNDPTYQLQLSLDAAAKPSTNTWTVASDARLKEVIGPYTKGLSELMKLRPVRYYYKNPGEGPLFAPDVLQKENVGFVAQEVAQVFPEAVDTASNGYLGLNIHAILIAYLNAIRELKAENDRLYSLIAEMQERQAELEKALARFGITLEGHSPASVASPGLVRVGNPGRTK